MSRHYSKTQHPRPRLQFAHARSAFAPMWAMLLKMNRKQRRRFKKGQRHA